MDSKYTISDTIGLSYTCEVIPFWKPYGNGPHVFCQWYKCKFTNNKHTYNCTEQYMMHQKAILFNDFDIANQILKETNPDKIRKLGRKVKNFDSVLWDKYKYEIVYQGNLYKFSQNEKLKKYLLSTDDAIIVEASPYDKIWGVGISEDNDDIYYPEKWKGENLLGFAIMEVRDNIREKENDNS